MDKATPSGTSCCFRPPQKKSQFSWIHRKSLIATDIDARSPKMEEKKEDGSRRDDGSGLEELGYLPIS